MKWKVPTGGAGMTARAGKTLEISGGRETRTEARRRVVRIELRNGTERAGMTNWVTKKLRWVKWKAPVGGARMTARARRR